nr:hypothetical protein GCM10023233_05730 [Brevibacterium otitidis]
MNSLPVDRFILPGQPAALSHPFAPAKQAAYLTIKALQHTALAFAFLIRRHCAAPRSCCRSQSRFVCIGAGAAAIPQRLPADMYMLPVASLDMPVPMCPALDAV